MANLVDFMQDIKNSDLKPLYVFVGDDIGLMNIYLDHIKPKPIRESSVGAVITNLTQRSLTNRISVYVIRDDKDFLKNESRWKRLEDIKYGTLVLMYTNLPSNSKFLKTFKDNVITFEKMTTPQLMNHFRKKYKINDRIIEQVIEFCQRDYSRISNELDKIIRLRNVSVNDVPSIVHHVEEFEVFKAIDHVIQYQPKLAFEDVQLMISKEENILGYLTLLYNQFSNACRVLGTPNAKESTVGVKQFLINKINKSFNYSLESAFTGMNIISKYIEGIKAGNYLPNMAVQMCLLEIFNLN